MASYGPERIQRGRKRLAIERLIVRLQEQRPSDFLVKGGFALELRLAGEARTTRDLDVSTDAEVATGSQAVVRDIEAACMIDNRDGFEFRLLGAPEEIAPGRNAITLRVSVGAFLADRKFESVPLDVRLGDLSPPSFDTLRGSELLESIGIPAPWVRVVSIEYHFAEKVHALTRPRTASNTRIRDLADLALLIGLGAPSDHRARRALKEVFEHGGTHSLPAELPEPPPEWQEGYELVVKQLTRVPKSLFDAWREAADFYRRIER
jgi:Nucleotidyl transferase AbiEii toxin, Type IV TA system